MGRGKIHWSDAALKEFKRRIRKLTGRGWFVSLEYRLKKLAQYLRGLKRLEGSIAKTERALLFFTSYDSLNSIQRRA